MAKAIDRQELIDDDRFASNELRCQHAQALTEIIESALTLKASSHWLALLETSGIPCGPINNVEQVLTDPQVTSRNMVISVEDPDVGTLKMAGNPIKITGFADPAQRAPAPALDEDREKILKNANL